MDKHIHMFMESLNQNMLFGAFAGTYKRQQRDQISNLDM
jgi:hypothetical protein